MNSVKRPAPWQRVLWVYLLILWGCTAGEWAFAAYCKHVLHRRYPLDTVLLTPAARFSDWVNFLPRTSHFGETGFLTRADWGFLFPYPLPSVLPYVLIQQLGPHPMRNYLVATILIFLICAALLSVYLARRYGWIAVLQLSVWSTVLVGYPGIWVIDRGNVEVFLWLLVCCGTYSFIRQRPYQAAACFAIAGSMKIYPAILLLLFLRRKQYRAMAFGVLVPSVFTLGTLAIAGPTIPQAMRDMKPAADTLRDAQIVALAPDGLRFDHSVFALCKQATATYSARALGWSTDRIGALRFDHSAKVYSIVAPIFFLLLYLVRIRTMPLLNQFLSLVFLALLLPFVSYDYTLVHLYVVFAVLLLALLEHTARPTQTKSVSALILLLAVIFSPLTALGQHMYAGQIKCCLLLISLGIAVSVPFPTQLFQDQEPALGVGSLVADPR